MSLQFPTSHFVFWLRHLINDAAHRKRTKTSQHTCNLVLLKVSSCLQFECGQKLRCISSDKTSSSCLTQQETSILNSGWPFLLWKCERRRQLTCFFLITEWSLTQVSKKCRTIKVLFRERACLPNGTRRRDETRNDVSSSQHHFLLQSDKANQDS